MKSVVVKDTHAKYELPDRLAFQLSGSTRPEVLDYEVTAFRPPLKGEYYLSGALVEAYLAGANLPTSYLIAEPIFPEFRRDTEIEI